MATTYQKMVNIEGHAGDRQAIDRQIRRLLVIGVANQQILSRSG